jgi:hypothetical protein
LGFGSLRDTDDHALDSLICTSKVLFVGELLVMAVFLAWLIRMRLRAPAPEPSIPAP